MRFCSPALAVLAALLLAAPAQAADTPTADANVAAAAVAADPTQVTGASFVDRATAGEPTVVMDTPLIGFPTSGSTYLLLDSTGANGAAGTGTHAGTWNVTTLKIDLAVPDGADCLGFDFTFLTTEDEGATFNDSFIAELDSTNWSASESSSEVTAPNNFARDSGNRPVSVNSPGLAFSSENAAGTGFSIGTAKLAAFKPVAAGSHSLYLTIFDHGDGVVNSAAYVDNLRLFKAPGVCLEGAQVVPSDVTPPETTLTATPGDASGASTEFSFTADEAGSTFECRLDGGAWASCTSPRALSGLAAGPHAFAVRATDAAGNVDASPVSHTWTVDLTAPETSVDTAPPGVSSSSSAVFAWSGEAGATYECSLDGAPYAACTSPASYVGLADGAHTFAVRGTDANGNVEATPATAEWIVDTQAPAAPELKAGPQGRTTQTGATFDFAGEAGATMQCRLDGGAWAACSAPLELTGLVVGDHRLELRQVDAAGNVGAVTVRSWTVAAPAAVDATLPGDPAGGTGGADAAVTVRGRSVAVGCQLDGAWLQRCTVKAYEALSAAAAAAVGRGRYLGSGTVAHGAEGRADARVDVRLNAYARAKLRRSPEGLRVRLAVAATPFGAAAPLRTTRVARFVPRIAAVAPAAGQFARLSAKLTPRVRAELREVAADAKGAARIVCTGHTSDFGASRENGRANRALGLARAKAVCGELRRLGVRAELVARSRGDEQPRATNRTPAGRALNRRVELRVVRAA